MIRFIGKYFKIMTLILLLAVSALSARILYADNTNKVKFTSTTLNADEFDPENGLVIDLYKIGGITGDVVDSPLPEYASLFTSNPSFIDPAEGGMSNEDRTVFADELAKIVFAENSKIVADKTLTFDTETEVDNLTMYLGIVRNKTAGSDYIKEDNGHYCSKFITKNNIYEFEPLLIFVQIDDLTIDLSKYKMQDGEFTIEKEYTSFVAGSKATCIFLIEEEINEKWVTKDVVSMTFSDAGKQTYTVKNIPVGRKVRVTEIYAGSAYKLSASDNTEILIEKSADMAKEGEYVASFTNDFDYDKTKGYGALNNFVVDEATRSWKDNGGGTENE